MSAGRICSRVIATASPTETVQTVARRMAEYDVGTLVILATDGSSRAAGIVTDRDIVTRCIAEGRDPAKTPVSELMTTPVEWVDEDTPIEDAVAKMASTAARRLVVTTHADRVVGVLSLDDVLNMVIAEAGAVGRLLEKQQPHIPA